MSDSVRTHRRPPTRVPGPWDSPGKNTGVGCHLLLQCMKMKSESEIAESCPTRSNPMDCSLPGSSIHWIFQARVLEWGAIASPNTDKRHGKESTYKAGDPDSILGKLLLKMGMATHCSILAWRSPWTEEPGGLHSMGSQIVWHDCALSTLFHSTL